MCYALDIKSYCPNPTVLERTFYKKECQINFQITQSSFQEKLMLNNVFDKDTFSQDWDDLKTFLVTFKGRQIQHNDAIVINEARENGLIISDTCLIKDVVTASEAVIFVTFAKLMLENNFSVLDIIPTYIENTSQPPILHILYRIYKTDFIKAMEKANLEVTEHSWNAFQTYLDRYHNLKSSAHLRLNIDTFKQTAAYIGYSVDEKTLTINHVQENEEYDSMDISLACVCTNAVTAIRSGFDAPDKPIIKEDTTFHLPYPEVRTSKSGMRMKFVITKDFYLKHIKDNALDFNAFCKKIASIADISDLKEYKLTNKYLTELAQLWGYETQDITLKDTELRSDIFDDPIDISISIKISGTLHDNPDNADIYNQIKIDTSAPITYHEIKEQLDNIHITEEDRMNNFYAYLARRINKEHRIKFNKNFIELKED